MLRKSDNGLWRAPRIVGARDVLSRKHQFRTGQRTRVATAAGIDQVIRRKVYVSLLFARQLRYRRGISLTGRGSVNFNPKLQRTFNSVRMKCSVKTAARQIED